MFPPFGFEELVRRARFSWERCPADDPLWAGTLEAMAAAWPGNGGIEAALDEATDDVPFAHLLGPFVDVARGRLDALLMLRGLSVSPRFSPLAVAAFERQLLLRLLQVAAPTLQHEFESGLSVGERLLRRLGPVPSTAGRTRYLEFVAAQRADRGRALFTRYPVLARLLATVVNQWVVYSCKLRLDLARDWQLLRDTFAPSGDLGSVQGVRPALSDPHRGGRTAALLHFDSGLKLIYKPRSLAQDVAFNALLEWCKREATLLPMRGASVLDRGDHGWCEFVEHRECRATESLPRYYRRAGQLLALLHLLRATDAHVENVVASGEHPVLVDLETLCHPELDLGAPVGPVLPAPDDVTRTGLLPEFDPSRGDVGGLSSEGAHGFVARGVQWQAVNTDAMHRRHVSVEARVGKPSTAADGGLPPQALEAELEAGFVAMARFFAARRAALASRAGPLASWRRMTVRVVLRNTSAYADLFRLALEPHALRDGEGFAAEVDRLAVAYRQCDARSPLRGLLEAERRAFGRLDVPLFTAGTDDLAVDDGCGLRVEGVLRADAWSEVLARIRGLDEVAIEAERFAIKARFAAQRRECRVDRSAVAR